MERARSNRLLLAHEDIEIIGHISPGLIREGFTVGLTITGNAALQILENHTFDVVVVSAELRCGVETRLYEELRHRYPRLPVVLLVEDDAGGEGRILAETDVFAYLIRPFDTRQISALARVAIDRSARPWIQVGAVNVV